MIHTISHKQKKTSFFSIRNKMITSFAVFAVSILTIVYIVAIYFASVSLLNNIISGKNVFRIVIHNLTLRFISFSNISLITLFTYVLLSSGLS